MPSTNAAAILSGLAGALTVTLLNEATRRTVPHSPRLDVLGMRALAHGARWMGLDVPHRLFASAMAGDLAANTAYYSMVAGGGSQNALATGAALGLVAGIGAVTLPVPMGLGSGPTDRTLETKIMSVAMYIAGGMAAGAVYSRYSEL